MEQLLRNISVNRAMALALLFGLPVSATAVEPLSFEEVKAMAEDSNVSWVQHSLGKYYENGRGVRQDYSKAFEWFKKSANQGYPYAQFSMGYAYESGQGVRQNHTVAKEWYGKSCDNGNQDGCDYYRKLNEKGY